MIDTKSGLVSIIIPSYNYGKYLPDALRCLINQIYSNWECLIIDDGSCDNTSQIGNKFAAEDSRIKYYHQNNSGKSSARNFGFASSQGDLICFLDSDDLWSEKYLANQIESLQTQNVDLIHSAYRIKQFETDEVIKSYNSSDFNFGSALSLLSPPPIRTSCVLIKRVVIDKIGGFDRYMKFIEDGDFWFKCAFEGFKFGATDNLDVIVRHHEGSAITHSFDNMIYNIIAIENHLRLIEHSNLNFSQKELESAIIKKIQTIRWQARDSDRFDWIFFTYMFLIRKIGIKYIFSKPFFTNFNYDIRIFISSKLRK
ncbi:MAG: glycosyltransferase [Melioribacteraceae bacterium]|nr:glycosyltransferase [Melioribacteraceae bacterium]MCF8262894.1 glycosyltransferase [Melioribacteraceae bacterium]MCF8430916.1 glycosyltransferase [Melioribacteraceae bacterium]